MNRISVVMNTMPTNLIPNWIPVDFSFSLSKAYIEISCLHRAFTSMSTNVSLYCTASKRTLLQWHMMSSDPPGIMFVEFFREKCLLAMDNDNTHPSTQGADKTPDEKLKINKLGPNAKNLIFVLQLK